MHTNAWIIFACTSYLFQCISKFMESYMGTSCLPWALFANQPSTVPFTCYMCNIPQRITCLFASLKNCHLWETVISTARQNVFVPNIYICSYNLPRVIFGLWCCIGGACWMLGPQISLFLAANNFLRYSVCVTGTNIRCSMILLRVTATYTSPDYRYINCRPWQYFM